MALNFESQAIMSINATPVIDINSNGKVRTPLQPSFYAQSGPATAVGAVVIATPTVFNIGNGYNVANGRFTAPVAGIYHFRWHQLAPNAGSGRQDAALYKNGAIYAGSRFIMQRDTASTFETMNVEVHIQLAVNDYVQIYYLTGPAALWADNGFGSFSGHLIG